MRTPSVHHTVRMFGFCCWGLAAFTVQAAFAAAPGVAGSDSLTNTAATTVEESAPARQDGRFITRLRWVSPDGSLPGTYAEYLELHPLTAAEFSGLYEAKPPADAPARGGRDPEVVSILVDSGLYPSIEALLDEYVVDLTSEGYSVSVETVTGGTPAEIKAWVQNHYAAGSEGFLFVGDITAAWAEVSGSVFPSDLYYMDLDGSWEDTDVDGDFETHTAGSGDEGPEVYVARIYAHTLNYDTEANMVNGYFDKAHAYRAGELIQPWQGLEYVDEDWFSMDVALGNVYGNDVDRHDYGYFTTAADYLNQMDLGYHFAQPCVHSYSGGHCFGTRPTESAAYAHVYVYSPSARAAKLLLGSDDGIKAWMNAGNVCTEDVYQGWVPDQFTVDVALSEGWNRLLCKVSQGGGSYQFSARITDPSLEGFSDLEYQLNDPEVYGAEAPFIRGWLLNGFHQDVSDNFWNYLSTNYLGVDEGAINPAAGEVLGGQEWTYYSADSGYANLGAHCADADFGACYAFARVYADSPKSVQLWLGYEDGARVWLNGVEVLNDNRYGGFEIDMSKLHVNLIAGENRLVVKVSEWMGAHGFSARFAEVDGTVVDGLTYDPVAEPIGHIGDWLFNGPYLNPDQGTRLSEDYLGAEESVQPSEGDPAPMGTWERGLGSGYPFDIGDFYDHGECITSQDIQDRDPPVLFYNLFACGPGRFTDSNYLAGAYMFNTTYGLTTLASSKSGSMLNFGDFTGPLGEGKTIGTAFREWFDAQAPFELWEREWYYGMILNGDPTLRVLALATPSPAPAPHDTPKNRYVSFTPNTGGTFAFQVELTASTYFPDAIGVLGWICEPGDNDVSHIVAEPFFSDTWPAVVHVGDCAVVPAATYWVRATDGIAISAPLEIATIAQPTPQYWADCVGAMEGDVWTEPNGVVNFNDVTAAVQTFTNHPTATHVTWVDLEPEEPNAVLNFADIQQIVYAFQGAPYPFSSPAACP